jgi:hypothetical protein|tara:strand:- start:1342 stop:2319 length:978 start_codon:yes stop_codon:yes gene_type:complete
MYYLDITNQVLDLVGASTGDDVETMTKASINRIYRHMLNIVDADQERREFSFTLASGKRQGGLPLYVKHVLNIDDDTNNKRIYDISAREFDITYPGTDTTGPPDKAYPLGEFGVQTQISSAEKVRINSSSTSDDGANFVLRVTGLSGGVLVTETITLDGTTNTESTNTYDAGGLERITKVAASGATWSGYLTLSGATSGTTFAQIPVWWDSPTYLWYEFWPQPTEAITYTVRAIMRKPDLVNDEDWPEVDDEFHNVIVWGAAAEVMPSVGKIPQSQLMTRNFQDGLRHYKQAMGMTQPNRIRVMSDVTTSRMPHARPLIKGVDYA